MIKCVKRSWMESAVLTSLGGRSYRFDTFWEKLILRMYGNCLSSLKLLELVQRFTDPPDADSEPGTGTDMDLRCAPKSQDFVLTGLNEDHLVTAPSGLPWSSRSLVLSSTTLRTTESVRRGQITHLVLDEVLLSDTSLFLDSSTVSSAMTVRLCGVPTMMTNMTLGPVPTIRILSYLDKLTALKVRMSEGKWNFLSACFAVPYCR